MIEIGTLIWLASIYGDDLNSDEFFTSYETNLHGLTAQIMNVHDGNYKQ